MRSPQDPGGPLTLVVRRTFLELVAVSQPGEEEEEEESSEVRAPAMGYIGSEPSGHTGGRGKARRRRALTDSMYVDYRGSGPGVPGVDAYEHEEGGFAGSMPGCSSSPTSSNSHAAKGGGSSLGSVREEGEDEESPLQALAYHFGDCAEEGPASLDTSFSEFGGAARLDSSSRSVPGHDLTQQRLESRAAVRVPGNVSHQVPATLNRKLKTETAQNATRKPAGTRQPDQQKQQQPVLLLQEQLQLAPQQPSVHSTTRSAAHESLGGKLMSTSSVSAGTAVALRILGLFAATQMIDEIVPGSWTIAELKASLQRHLKPGTFVEALLEEDPCGVGRILELSDDHVVSGLRYISSSVGLLRARICAHTTADKATWTTVMLRNLPNDYTREDVLDLLDSGGFQACYDFFYMPVDFQSGSGMGYAFVNFVSHEKALQAWEKFNGFCRWRVGSHKVCEVCWGDPLQGLPAHTERYRNSAVMHEEVPESFKPLLFASGVRVPFPLPTRKIRAPRRKTPAYGTSGGSSSGPPVTGKRS